MHSQRFVRLMPVLAVVGFSSIIDRSFVLGESHEPHAVELIAIGRLPGSAVDLSAADTHLEEGTPANQAGGFSAIEYTGEGDRFWLLPDRGPADGATGYACRIQEIELKIDEFAHSIQPRILTTILLRGETGEPLIGSLKAVPEARYERGSALDPEGLRLSDGGGFFISEEYGPAVDLFSPDGRRVKSRTLPKSMALTRETDLSKAKEGTMPNRGLEGLAKSLDGKSLIAAMQGPLIQDSESKKGKRYSDYTRLIRLAIDSDAPPQQYLYPLADRNSGISEILALDADRYLVLERDGEKRPQAVYKSIYIADLSHATDIADRSVIPHTNLPDSIRAATKQPFIDLLDDRWTIPEEHRLEKPEGLAWGRNLADGRRLLIVCFDNDFQTEVDSLFLAFGVR